MGKGVKVIEVPFAVGARTWCVYLKPFSQMEQGWSFLQLERGQYIEPSEPIKPTKTILEKAQQKSIIAIGARQQ